MTEPRGPLEVTTGPVLVVDDQPAVRGLFARALRESQTHRRFGSGQPYAPWLTASQSRNGLEKLHPTFCGAGRTDEAKSEAQVDLRPR
jgi:CheY-like chemotaxis protein